MPLGDRLKELRTTAGLSVREAAKLIGKSPGYLSRVETRGEIPAPELLIAIAQAYAADAEELLREAKQDYMERVEQEIDSKQQRALAVFRKEKR